MNSEDQLITISKFQITSADTDMYAQIRLGAFVNLLVQSAINSADWLSFGFENLKEHNLFWVLNRLTIEIYRPLKWYEEIEVETWPKDIDRLLYIRDFIIRDKEKNIVAKATSGWLAVDIESKRPKKFEGIQSDFFDLLRNKIAIKDIPEKLNPLNMGDQFEVNPTYYDIDLNKHVTATRYIDWMMDSLPWDTLKHFYPKKISINYLR